MSPLSGPRFTPLLCSRPVLLPFIFTHSESRRSCQVFRYQYGVPGCAACSLHRSPIPLCKPNRYLVIQRWFATIISSNGQVRWTTTCGLRAMSRHYVPPACVQSIQLWNEDVQERCTNETLIVFGKAAPAGFIAGRYSEGPKIACSQPE